MAGPADIPLRSAAQHWRTAPLTTTRTTTTRTTTTRTTTTRTTTTRTTTTRTTRATSTRRTRSGGSLHRSRRANRHGYASPQSAYVPEHPRDLTVSRERGWRTDEGRHPFPLLLGRGTVLAPCENFSVREKS